MTGLGPRPILAAVGEEIKSLTYRFRWKDGRERDFEVRLSHPAMRLQAAPRSDYPDWTKLESHQCGNCPLKPADNPRCPVAVSLIDLIELFKDIVSTEVAEAVIITENREYHKTAAVQEAVSSLMGLCMATAGCPVLDKLRPMAYTHLPFSTLKETVYRGISMYLMAQFLRHKRGLSADWELGDLKKIYEDINAVNRSFIERLQSVAERDSSLNALVKLDCLAGFTVFSIERHYVKELEQLFAPYLSEPA